MNCRLFIILAFFNVYVLAIFLAVICHKLLITSSFVVWAHQRIGVKNLDRFFNVKNYVIFVFFGDISIGVLVWPHILHVVEIL